MTQPDPASAGATPAARWLARGAWLAVVAAIVLLLAAGTKTVAVLVVAVVGVVVFLAAAWWFLSNRSLIRWVAAFLAIAAPVVVIAVYISRNLLLPALGVIVLLLIAGGLGRAALSRASSGSRMPERLTPPPKRPYFIMNPRSGGGKVTKFQLDKKAAALGANVALIDGPGQVDVAAMARAAVAAGADLLGVAGGDGTQALVAAIAAEHDIPFLVLSAGTRNHFALDLGLDRERPESGLAALTDGVEVTLDLGLVGGRTFVNNASFGAYAAIVESPAYRADKRGTTLKMLPDLLSGDSGPRLTARIGDDTIDAPTALLISNNPYEMSDPAGLGRRARIDGGKLGVIAVSVHSAAQAAALVRVRSGRTLQRFDAIEVVVESDAAEIPVGVDGESLMLPTPVRCQIWPAALRVRVPRERLAAPAPPPRKSLGLLTKLALNR
ncbi:diacylglycerol kinase family enzyme [Jatrophihabitans sp. GAS493]|uniref:diacylglycerol/lipid kinase family protein n=1 Tax=Jatrophihabitans sp. GAS493 TaxID=1907575 RepID=UPI000BB6C604|nr:diacylglycerol kinase family protein [Jatrophihabitans sp. GAS493]SOD74897.1 diacylglycerol kinase family enzyme [Jatrophihabitans sp. GAS493]